jgi:hypothetical protein
MRNSIHGSGTEPKIATRMLPITACLLFSIETAAIQSTVHSFDGTGPRVWNTRIVEYQVATGKQAKKKRK